MLIFDTFHIGMRSRYVQSEFCSPFLVNSICAIACVSVHFQRDCGLQAYRPCSCKLSMISPLRIRIEKGSLAGSDSTTKLCACGYSKRVAHRL